MCSQFEPWLQLPYVSEPRPACTVESGEALIDSTSEGVLRNYQQIDRLSLIVNATGPYC